MTQLQQIKVDLRLSSTDFVRIDNSEQVETGPLQFNSDQPGVFIRGDYAAFYAMQLRHLVRYVEDNADHIDFYALNSAKKLIDLFSGCVTVSTDEDHDAGC